MCVVVGMVCVVACIGEGRRIIKGAYLRFSSVEEEYARGLLSNVWLTRKNEKNSSTKKSARRVTHSDVI